MIRKAIKSDIEKIKPYIEEFNLDSDDLDYKKTYVFEKNGLIVGFGRYKKYDSCYEIASVGVLKDFRGQGIGKSIVNQLINTIPSHEIWITTVIPEYFKKFGFKKINNNIPEPINLKTFNICQKFNKSKDFSTFMSLKK